MPILETRGAYTYWPDDYRDPAYGASPEMLAALEAAVRVARRLGVGDTYPALGESDSAEMLPRLVDAIGGAVPGLRVCARRNYAEYGGGPLHGATGAIRALLHAHVWLGVWGAQRHHTFDRLVIHAPRHEAGCADPHSYLGCVTVVPYGPRGYAPEEGRATFDRPEELRSWLRHRGGGDA